MTLPLVVLGGAAAVAGVLNLPFAKSLKFLEHWLEPSLFGNEHHATITSGGKWLIAIVAIIVGLVAIAAAMGMYLRGRGDRRSVELPILANGWGYDGAVTAFMGGPGRAMFNALTTFDRTVIDGIVNGVPRLLRNGSGILRRAQSGLVRSYAAGIAGGAVVLLVWVLTRMSL